jgi:hypothetical protein
MFSEDIIKDRGIEINSVDMLQEYLTLSDDEMGSYKRKGFHMAKRICELGETYLKKLRQLISLKLKESKECKF